MIQQMQPRADVFGVPLGGWSFATQSPEVDDCATITACEQCGDTFLTEDPADDVLCCACSMPPAELAALRMVSAPRPACTFCGELMYGADCDGARHPRCARFVASLAPVAIREEEAIAA